MCCPTRVLFNIGFLVWTLSAGRLLAAVPSAHDLRSPDGRIAVSIRISDRIFYDIAVDENTVMRDATLSLHIDGATLGLAPKLLAATPRYHDGMVIPPVRQKSASYRDRYNEICLKMDGNYAVVFRAYDEGVAYRWETTLPQSQVKVFAEEMSLRFADNYVVYYPEEQSFMSHNERQFSPRALADLSSHNLASLPAVVDARTAKLVVAESDVDDYPGLWLRGNDNGGLEGLFPPYPLKEQLSNDRDLHITQAADYIAITRGTRTYPWRVLGVAHRDGDIITSPLVYLLASPSQVADTSWIKPGKAAWDWWNANNVAGVDFKSGINTATYKYYIDFAARYGLQYIILDEGWSKLGDLLSVVPEINIEELVAYGRERNVGVILWVVWKTLDDQLQPALDQFARWGVRGIKVDFMQRDDQPVVNFYHRVCREAAKRHLLVDYHGAVRPALMTRTWPNLITAEGVRGLEWCKWTVHTNPDHDVMLPFTRMFLGPMDYTPGAMLNATRSDFRAIMDQPMSQGTRCHQLALFVVFESPLQMLADSPTHYRREPEAMEFLAAVPTVWDETRVLDARLGDYALVARRRGSDWFLGAITNWTPRELEVDLSFLPAGSYQLTQWSDGINADRYAGDFQRSAQSVSNITKLRIRLAEGGGWAARISPHGH
ncbi:MAG: glycoside hydrolase family 97 protein [Opitutaceae bacterium]